MAGETIPDILEYIRGGPENTVATEGWHDRAQEMLDAEQAKGEAARPTLIAQLEAILVSDDPDDELDNDEAVALAEPDVVDPVDEPGTIVWFRRGDGAEFEVTAGTDAHERLVAEGWPRIDGPTIV